MPSPPPVTTVQKHGRIEGLDLLRLVAALSVVAFHYTFRGAAADSLTSVSLPAVTPVTKYAYLGVQMFFVISGFVIAYSAEGRTAREFFIARAARIYPGFLVCMTATFVVTLAFGMPRFETSLGQWLANLFIFSPALGHKFMDGVYWSIVYELIFYGWAFALILFGVFARKVTLIVILWLAISVVNEMLVGSIALRLLFLTDESGFFCAGMLLYAVYADRVGRLTLPLLAISTFAGAAQSVLHVNWVRGHYHEAFSDTVTASVCVGAVALVGLCLLPKRIPFRRRRPRHAPCLVCRVAFCGAPRTALREIPASPASPVAIRVAAKAPATDRAHGRLRPNPVAACRPAIDRTHPACDDGRLFRGGAHD